MLCAYIPVASDSQAGEKGLGSLSEDRGLQLLGVFLQQLDVDCQSSTGDCSGAGPDL